MPKSVEVHAYKTERGFHKAYARFTQPSSGVFVQEWYGTDHEWILVTVRWFTHAKRPDTYEMTRTRRITRCRS